MKRLLPLLKSKNLYLSICRYALGLMMIPYAVSKILQLQFVVLPVHTWQQPLEKLSGIALAWSFLGYSPWFQTLLGVLELLPALLLLYRRTTLIGAILMLPMTLNVFLINEAYNLWTDTKQISFLLLVLNIFVLLFEWKNIQSILAIIFNKERKFKFNTWEMVINFIFIATAVILPVIQLMDYLHQTNELTGDWYNKHPNEWVLQSEKVNADLLPERVQKCYFGAYGSYEEVSDTGVNKRHYQYTLNKEKHLLQLHGNKNSTTRIFSYMLTSDTIMVLQRTLDSSNGLQLTQVFKKRVINLNK